MSDTPSHDGKTPEPNNTPAPAAPLVPVPQVEQKLEAFARDLPENKQEEFKHTIQQVFAMMVDRSGGPRIDSETAKILSRQRRQG